MVCVLRTECSTNEDVGDILRRFWELESIGISDQPSNKKEEQNELLNEFNRTIRNVNGRCEVGLPFRVGARELKGNHTPELKRLESLKKRLSRDEAFAKDYDNVIYSYITSGHAEKVPKPPIFRRVDKPTDLLYAPSARN
ncbi:hypothetical protein HPB47_012972 [Ixodes persulcatus]|uniref:Uncharacterized protein n=1 Tax=Ixodes persulcatus TaxID=34615 RepID=A0AC60NS33_IXOPE|nr:hypothetical protein HPB47_012972 [Ixodes persulcatus]